MFERGPSPPDLCR